VTGARQLVQRVLPAAVSAVALAWVLKRFELGRLADALSWDVLLWLVPALLGYGAVTLLLEALSILRLIERPPPGFGAWTAARIKCASYLLAIVNYTLGGAALTLLLRRRAALPLGVAASVVLLVSMTDLVVVLGLGALGAATIQAGGPTLRAGVAATAGLGFFAGLALLRAPGSLGPLERLRTLSVFDALRHTPASRLLELLALRVIFCLAFFAVGGFAFQAFGIEISGARLVLGMAIMAIVGALPIAVAGLGTGQIAAVYVFEGVATAETLVALSLVLSAGLIALRAGMGILFAREFTREALEQGREGAA